LKCYLAVSGKREEMGISNFWKTPFHKSSLSEIVCPLLGIGASMPLYSCTYLAVSAHHATKRNLSLSHLAIYYCYNTSPNNFHPWNISLIEEFMQIFEQQSFIFQTFLLFWQAKHFPSSLGEPLTLR